MLFAEIFQLCDTLDRIYQLGYSQHWLAELLQPCTRPTRRCFATMFVSSHSNIERLSFIQMLHSLAISLLRGYVHFSSIICTLPWGYERVVLAVTFSWVVHNSHNNSGLLQSKAKSSSLSVCVVNAISGKKFTIYICIILNFTSLTRTPHNNRNLNVWFTN